MHNRVVDRAAAHATSAELAVRDWLLVALSFSTGIYEAKPRIARDRCSSTSPSAPTATRRPTWPG